MLLPRDSRPQFIIRHPSKCRQPATTQGMNQGDPKIIKNQRATSHVARIIDDYGPCLFFWDQPFYRNVFSNR